MPWVADSHATMGRLGIPSAVIDGDDLRRLFPSIDTPDRAVLEPEAGVLRAAEAVTVLARRARRRGAGLTAGRATPDGTGALVDGARRDADVVVWACGPWLPALFPDLVRASVTRQEVVFFGVGPEWAAPGVPGWIDHDHGMYGAGDVAGKGFKVASDRNGPEFDPDHGHRVTDPAAVEHCRRYLVDAVPRHRRRPGDPHPHLSVHLDAGQRVDRGPPPRASRRMAGGCRVGARVQARPGPRASTWPG